MPHHKKSPKFWFAGVRATGLALFWDSAAWWVAVPLAAFLRLELAFSTIRPFQLVGATVALLLVSASIGWMTHLYRDRYVAGSIDELKALLLTVSGVTFVVLTFLALLPFPRGFPRSVLLISIPIFIILAGAFRLMRRSRVYDLRSSPSPPTRAVIYGAGSAAESLIPQLLSSPSSPYLPVVMLDDSPEKANRQIRGIPTVGTWDRIGEVASDYSIKAVIVAMPSVVAGRLDSIYKACLDLGLEVVVVPSLQETLGAQKAVGDLRRVTIEDLVGRQAVELDSRASARFVGEKSIVVTGAGGSIGAELVKQLGFSSPKKIVLVDHDESNMLLALKRAERAHPRQEFEIYLGDIRDPASVDELFSRHRPQIVFHAAALKHVEILEAFPLEAWKTNVIGTKNVLQAAARGGVEALVNVSTDKAANAANMLGRSKKIAEEMTAWVAHDSGRKFVSVRFGNVMGSRGSLVPLLEDQISEGGPVWLTNSEATRYFMTIPEACQLVIQAASDGGPGDVLLLDMGAPVRIRDVAERMIQLSGKDIAIRYTGLKAGEKLHEDLVATDEKPVPSLHPKILRITSSKRDPGKVGEMKW